jgi:hypothetical protein
MELTTQDLCSIQTMNNPLVRGLAPCPNIASTYCTDTQHLLCPTHEKMHLVELGCQRSAHVRHRVGQRHPEIRASEK